MILITEVIRSDKGDYDEILITDIIADLLKAFCMQNIRLRYSMLKMKTMRLKEVK